MASQGQAAAAAPKPRLLAISLELQPFFDEQYASLTSRVLSKAALQRAQSESATRRALAATPPPSAVLITDAALSTPEHLGLWGAVLDYVREGGTAVIMGHFSSFVLPPDIKGFFALAGLPWDQGDYHRTTVWLDKDAAAATCAQGAVEQLPESYSQKAVFLKNVDPAFRWYGPGEDSTVESRVFAPEKIQNVTQASIALATVGRGRLGYVGDVNGESESEDVVLAMCGLL